MIRTLRRGSKSAGFLAVAALFSLLAVAPAQALTIDFSGGFGGTIALLGGGNASGTNININNMLVVGNTGGLNGNFAVTGGLLNFNTITGALSITGTVPALGVAGTLLSGTIASHSIIGPIGTFLAVTAAGDDRKLQALLNALGGEAATIADTFTFFGFTISANFDPATGTGTAISTDFANNPRVPEPASLLLLGAGLAGLGALGWRFRRS